MVDTNSKKKEYDYDKIHISLQNCILPIEKIDETPSMKDGLDRDTENELRMFACEMIQTAGILLRIPQVAMATGQVILQRFYFSKSMVKHDIEATAMAAIFLAAKIEESSRRLRDVINVCQHIKQRLIQKPHTPMDYFSQTYFNLKNAVIKAERRLLKELGFCVHVKHPHKLIVTYLQMLDHEKNQSLARKAWNYMNDSLRSDVFVRFPPETIACACIFLAARIVKVNLPLRPPWYELFDATYDDIEEISFAIMRLYSKPRRKLSILESIVNKLRKEKTDKTIAALKNEGERKSGSFTPSRNDETSQPPNALSVPLNNNVTKSDSKPSSRTTSPVEKSKESVITTTKNGDTKKPKRRHRSDSEGSYATTSDSEADLPNKKYTKQKKNNDDKRGRKRSPSSDSDNDHRRVSSKSRRSASPEDRRSNKLHRDSSRNKLKDSNGHYDKNYSRSKRRSRSRSRSPVKRTSPSPSARKDKYKRERERDRETRIRSKDKYSSKSRR